MNSTDEVRNISGVFEGLSYPNPLVFITGIAAAVFLAVLLSAEKRDHKGPKRWPLVGSYFQVVKNFPVLHDWFLSYFSSECRTIAVDWGTFYNILTVDPANVEHILKTNFANYPKGRVSHARNYDFMGDGIFNSDGEMWKRHRKLASYEFSSKKVNEYSGQVFRKAAVRMMEVLENIASKKTSFDFQDISMRMTLDSICEVAFGVELNTLSPSLPAVPFAASFDRVNELIVRRLIGPVWKILRALNLGSERELKNQIQVLDSFTFQVIENRRQEIEACEKSGKEYVSFFLPNKTFSYRFVFQERQDLLSRFMTSTGASDAYHDRELRDAILNFIIAGRDTTAITLSWFIYCICNNPRVAKEIRLELDRTFGSESNTLTFSAFAQLLSTENLRTLHYLHACISETLRLYPPVPRDGKYAANDDVLPDGTKVKRGDSVAYVQYSMGRMEFLWGPDALEFKPERWIKNSEYQPQSPFVYTAFQAGPRICLGKDAAYLQAKITAAMLMRFFNFELVKDHVVHYRLLMVLAMVNGIKVNVSTL
ncbi:hypothetical protein SELMODRAFT_151517 [Selaginella moellendorffii]|uniref:Uncharacterized protein CYP704J1 n=1 Tax=Selaginella moellendorffii TaxID=88036 RepID=D8S0I1_SELML|nr:hypothetical protein SELMODRAFT_151517 [Selaginella moellendorffii]